MTDPRVRGDASLGQFPPLSRRRRRRGRGATEHRREQGRERSRTLSLRCRRRQRRLRENSRALCGAAFASMLLAKPVLSFQTGRDRRSRHERAGALADVKGDGHRRELTEAERTKEKKGEPSSCVLPPPLSTGLTSRFKSFATAPVDSGRGSGGVCAGNCTEKGEDDARGPQEKSQIVFFGFFRFFPPEILVGATH